MNLTYECLRKINPDFDFKGRDNVAKKRTYTDKEKRNAIILSKNTTVKNACSELGITYGTMSTWITADKKNRNIKILDDISDVRL